MALTQFRTDRNNNPIAFIVEIASQAGLVKGEDYEIGDSFESNGNTYFTAKLLNDPILTCIQVIDKIGFYTKTNTLRWNYIGIPVVLWNQFTFKQKVRAIYFMYHQEGGIKLENLFLKELG